MMIEDEAVVSQLIEKVHSSDCHKCRRRAISSIDDLATRSYVSLFNRMIICSNCGNKRCPKASDHELKCTGSNAPGQPGSVYV